MIPEERRGASSCEWAEIEKYVEAEMIRCFELALYMSHESRTKKKQYSEDSISPSMCIS